MCAYVSELSRIRTELHFEVTSEMPGHPPGTLQRCRMKAHHKSTTNVLTFSTVSI
jgi:hypothetical protein